MENEKSLSYKLQDLLGDCVPPKKAQGALANI